jgi:hypothetical protein
MFRESYLPSSGASLHLGSMFLTISQSRLWVVALNPFHALFERQQLKVRDTVRSKYHILEQCSSQLLPCKIPTTHNLWSTLLQIKTKGFVCILTIGDILEVSATTSYGL